MWRGFYDSLTFRLSFLLIWTAALTYFALKQEWWWLAGAFLCWLSAIELLRKLFKRNAQKVAFMFDAIDNADHAFRYAVSGRSSNDKLINSSLNRIIQILFQAQADTIQKEKYYELILNSVNTGVIVLDDNGYIFQTNNEALRLLGLSVFTHLKQLRQLSEGLEDFFTQLLPGNRHQVSFSNERGMVHLSVRVSEMTLRDKHVRILAINDINSELDDKEIDSWIRLTRVLTHEIMNAVTPITSLSDTLLSIHGEADKEIRNGLETISTTGKGLISFVESYRKFTHIPTPRPALFYVLKFAQRMVQLAKHQNDYPQIAMEVSVQPEDLIVYADESLISQVV
ncbi:MAG: PAS domain-containing protein, partial [Tannerellaceae bacterium]|nr:PAS domain-containing protein [Tannerellaceae bacterium]